MRCSNSTYGLSSALRRQNRKQKNSIYFLCFLTVVAIFAAVSFASLFFAGKANVDDFEQESSAFLARLRKDKANLRSQIRDYKSKAKEHEKYAKQIRESLARLNNVLDSAKKVGIIKEEDLQALNRTEKSADGGIGGYETDCDDEACSEINAWNKESESAVLPTLEEGELSLVIDRYASLIQAIPFSYPVKTAKITSFFGVRHSPFSSRIKMHQGIDFAAKRGTAIYASGSGIVKTVKYSATYGNYVEIRHTNRVVTRYAHLSRATVKVGDRVSGSSLIGYSGSTGRVTGPHLHYEVLVDNVQKDPMLLFKLGRTLRESINNA